MEHLSAVGSLYPKAWRQIDKFRASKGKGGLPDWPDWCFLPMAGFYAIVSKEADVVRLPPHLLPDVARLAAIGTWRYTQGIYRFGPDVRDAVMSAKIPGGLPCNVLYRLPEWCVYIETPGKQWGCMPLHGFFAHLEWDSDEGVAALRLLLDCEPGLFPFPIRLGVDALDGAVACATDSARVQSRGAGRFSGTGLKQATDGLADNLEPLVLLVMHLCSEYTDIAGQDDAPMVSPMPSFKEGGGLSLADAPFDYALETVRIWDVGIGEGAVLRKGREFTVEE